MDSTLSPFVTYSFTRLPWVISSIVGTGVGGIFDSTCAVISSIAGIGRGFIGCSTSSRRKGRGSLEA
jgi:hypothetical protein